MKRFIVSALCVSLAFIGAGTVVDKMIAGYKSDEKALAIIAKARTAIGGDAKAVRSFIIKGQTSKTVSIDGTDRLEQGETEIVFEAPNRLIKMVKLGDANAAGGDAIVEKVVDVVVVGKPGDGPHKVTVNGSDGEFTTEGGHKVIVRKAEGPAAEGETKVFVRQKADGGEWTPKDGEVKEVVSADGKKFTVVRKGGDETAWTTEGGDKVMLREKMAAHGAPSRDNELLRTTLSLLLTAPEGTDAAYKYAGETSLDGTAADVVIVSSAGSSFKLFIDRSTSLPLGVSYLGHAPVVVKMRKSDDGSAPAEKDVVTFSRRIEGPATGVETLVRFADFRSVDGLLLPYKWTTTVGGKASEVFDVSSYELNANVAERFKGEKVLVRTKK